MRRAPSSAASGKAAPSTTRRSGPGLSGAGRSIVGAPKAAAASANGGGPISRGDANSSVRPSSRGSIAGSGAATSSARPGSRGSITGARRLVATAHEGRLSSKGSLVSAGAAAAADVTSRAQKLDDELRDAVLGVFRWCDADADGILNRAEYVAAQRMIAELCSEEFDEGRANGIFDSASDGGVGGLVDAEGFLNSMQALVSALKLPRRQLLTGLKQQTSRKSSAFDRSVSDLKQALVRNVSNLPEQSTLDCSPPPPTLWRTETGGHSFTFPPGVIDGHPVAQVAFKMMQFLGMLTEDSSFIEAELAAKMMGHRQMFRNILQMCGDIKGVHVDAPGPGVNTVDIFLAKSMNAEQMFRVRLSGMVLRTSPATKLIGMGGFEPSPIDPSEIPATLLMEMQATEGNCSGAATHLSALGQAPPPPMGLTRQKSIMCEADLQTTDLVLTAAPIARHLFRIRFKLAGSSQMSASNYLVLLPRIKTAETGHARYADHEVRVNVPGIGAQPECKTFDSFRVASIRGHALQRLVVEHEFTSCQVRVQERSAARRSEISSVIELSAEERANNLACDDGEREQLKQWLNSQGLARRSGERDIAYAVRLGRALRQGYEYDVDITEAHVKNLTSLIWQKRRGDCSAFNTGFVYALRAFDVPARVSLGFKYGQAVKHACGAVSAPHCETEFYAEGIGWVPCDATQGLKRLGHDGGTALSFVEWRPANMTLQEAEEMAQVLQPPQHLDYELLQKRIEELAGGDTATAKELAHVIAKQDNVSKDKAERRVAQILRLCGLDGRPAVPIRQFARCWAAEELGKFSELGAGGGLTSTSKAGIKFYEGGPFKDSPLELEKLKENMMVPDDVEKVVETVGGRPVTYDWASMWPHGVFLCNYEFEERPLPSLEVSSREPESLVLPELG